jgi:hypothetical protein
LVNRRRISAMIGMGEIVTAMANGSSVPRTPCIDAAFCRREVAGRCREPKDSARCMVLPPASAVG